MTETSKIFSKDARLGLDPGLRLRPDVDRAVLITRPPPLADRSYICRLLHPTEAVIFSLMDGRRSIQEVANLWADVTDKSEAEAFGEVSRLIGHYTTGELGRDRILVEANGSDASRIRKYDPLDFVIRSERINLSDRRLRIPYMVHYLPTLFCPQDCIYCYAKTCKKPENNLISLPRLREIFAELRELGVEVIQMSGGEVFARKNIFAVLEAIFEADMVPDIPTKIGLGLEQARRLKDLGLETIQFSLDSSDPSILDHMVGVENHHRAAFRTLDNFRRVGLVVRVNSVLTPHNIPSVGLLIDYLGDLGNVYRVSLSPYGRSAFHHREGLFVDEADLSLVEQNVSVRRQRYPHMKVTVGSNGAPEPVDEDERKLEWERRAFCTANRDGFVILPDGRVTVCEELYDHPDFLIGDLTSQSVMEMWQSRAALGLLAPSQETVPDGPCRTCEYFLQCNSVRGRCWRDVLKSYGWDNAHYPDPRCPQAPAGNRLG